MERAIDKSSQKVMEPATARPRPMGIRGGDRIGFYVMLAILWEFGIPALGVPDYVLPIPSAIWRALVRGFTTGTLWNDLGVTVLETLIGFGMAVGIGVLLGGLIVEVPAVDRVVYPLVVGLQSLPKVALAPLILIWAGYGFRSKVLTAALVAFFPMLVNTVTGLKAYDSQAGELFRSLSATRWQQFRYLKIPSAVPYLVAGLNVAFVFALLGALVGEFIGASAGLGYAIMQLQFQLDTAGVFAILLVLACLGIAGDRLIAYLGTKATFWRQAPGPRRPG